MAGVAIMGYGVVGSGVAEIIEQHGKAFWFKRAISCYGYCGHIQQGCPHVSISEYRRLRQLFLGRRLGCGFVQVIGKHGCHKLMYEFVGMRGIIGVFAPLHVTGLERRVQCVSYTDHGQVIGCTDLCHLFLTGVPVLQHSKQQYHRRLLWLIQAFLYQAFVGNAVLCILGVIDCKLNEDYIRRILKQFLLRPEQSQYRGGAAESSIDVLYFLSFGELRLEVLMGMCCIAISSRGIPGNGRLTPCPSRTGRRILRWWI